MVKNIVLLFLLGIGMMLSGCDAPNTGQAQLLPGGDFVADAEKGKVLFRAQCSRCHGKAAKGTDQGPPLIHKFYHPNHHADLAFYWAVKDGTKQHHWHFGDMPPIANVSPQQVGHIIAYVRRQQRKAGIY